MMDNADDFHGLPVKDFQSAADWDGPEHAYRVRVNWESKPGEMIQRLDTLAAVPGAAKIKAIVIGMWASDSQDTSESVVKKLAALAPKFPGVTGLFIGDIAQEENEISWIQQTDISPLLKAYAKLAELKVRGGNELSFSPVVNDSLETLTIETGGLPRSVLRELTRCTFPNLQSLELWLGSDGYGRDGGAEDLQPILSGKYFPRLESLGICNVEGFDDYVPVIVNAPIIARLKTLNLSYGDLSDVGGKSLLDLAKHPNLKMLDLFHHYLTPGMVKQLQKGLSCTVNAADAREPDDEWRSIYVSE